MTDLLGERGMQFQVDAAIKPVRDAFVDAWSSGMRPQIKDMIGTDYRVELLRELLRVELAYRRRNGEHPHRDEYAELPSEVVAEAFAE